MASWAFSGETVLAIALIIVASCVVFLLVALLAALFGAILFGGLSGLSHYDSHGIGLMLLVMAFVGIMLLAFAAVGVLCAAASSCVALVVARARVCGSTSSMLLRGGVRTTRCLSRLTRAFKAAFLGYLGLRRRYRRRCRGSCFEN